MKYKQADTIIAVLLIPYLLLLVLIDVLVWPFDCLKYRLNDHVSSLVVKTERLLDSLTFVEPYDPKDYN